VTPADADIERGYWETGKPPSATGSAGGATDDGRDEISVLNYWRKNGVPNEGHRILAYAGVDVDRVAHVKAAIAFFGGVYIGVELPLTAQSQEIWDVVPNAGEQGQPDSWGGHAIPILGYDADYLYVVTWGAVLKMTYAFMAAYVDEVYACISPDFLDAQ